MNKEIRWKQRFQNLEKAYSFLKEGLKKPELDLLQQAGIIQGFEFTFELSWKTLKDLLEYLGTIAASPRDAIKEAFAMHIIQDGHLWLEMLERRNILSHTYSEEQSAHSVLQIRTRYFPAFEQLYLELKKRCLV